MSAKVREWLRLLRLFDRTTHTDRLDIDKEIERITGVNCDKALNNNMITKDDFIEIVKEILSRKRKIPIEMIA